VTVGSVGGERRIQNVAAGLISATSTDAINGSQLYTAYEAINALSISSGAGWNLQANGNTTTITPINPTLNVVDGSNTTVSLAGNQLQVNVVNNPTFSGPVTANGGLSVGNNLTVQPGTTVDMGGNRITNVADGQAPTDAVTVQQLQNAQMEKEKEFRDKVDAEFNIEIGKVQKEISKYDSGIQDKINRHKELEKQSEEVKNHITNDKEVIYNKYRDKVVYRYPLNQFMSDGYSKKVKRIETSASDEDKMLNVVLLSQFRKYFAYSEGVTSTFKPIVLFKSPKVSVSLEANESFNRIIENLNTKDLLTFIRRQKLMDSNKSSALSSAYDFYLEKELELGKIVQEIKRDFDARNVLNANDTSGNMLEKGQYQALNTLENPNNLYRVVFAVAKLTEGWDVLNLYDIVRIEKEAGTNKTATMAEAQLIGRGARYYPFEIQAQKSYQRRFDNEASNKQLILETLHYHTMNEPQYLKQLVGSLKQMDLPTGEDKKNPPIEIKVKSSFKKTEAYKKGKIYYNEVVSVEDDWFDSIDKYGITHQTSISRSLNYGSREVSYQSNVGKSETKSISVDKFDSRYIQKAIQRLEFYKFDNLKKYIPLLSSIKEFIYGRKWLNANDLHLFLTVPKEYRSIDITPDDILNVIIELLKEYEVKFKSGYIKQRGTNKFIGYPIKEYLTNYNKRVPEYDTMNLFNETMQKIEVYEIEDDFFVYEKAIVNKLEYELIERVKSYVTDLKEKYHKAVYLLRMDENMHRESAKSEKLKLHQYGSRMNRSGEVTETHLQGFQPDFILFLEDSEFYFQIFIEPKGMSGDRFISELWKQDLLLYMTDNQGEMEFEANEENVRISGLKFYTRGDGQNTMEQLADIVQTR